MIGIHIIKHFKMKHIIKSFFLLCTALLVVGVRTARADDARVREAMLQDYPGLMALYGDRITGQKAHYIFVVDVSSSMRPYESTVKRNILQFLDAVPDGDQISLIKMSDENHTGYVGLLKCTHLSPEVRSSIREVVNGFKFNRNGSNEDGSDGFTMAGTVIDAINTVGSNDLTFVYMLTDFEYWTHKYKYDKNKENWTSLISQLPEAKMGGMCKYGIELNAGGQLRQDAIFKNELDRIFGKVEYQSVGSAALLSNWFSHIATGVTSVKLNSLLKADWKEVDASVNGKVSVSGGNVKFRLDAMKTPLVNGATATLRTDSRYFQPVESEGPFPGSINTGKLVPPSTGKSPLPDFIDLGGGDYEAKITLLSPYSDEISRLQGVCGEVAGQGDAVNLNRVQSGKLPSALVWNSTLPAWLWALILLIILAILASFVYQFCFTRLNRKWMVFIKASYPDGTSKRYDLEGVAAPFTIGATEADLPVRDANWRIRVFTERHNPALFFLKSGYYMVLEQGDFADVQTDNDYDPRTVSVGEKVFLYKAGKAGQVSVKITEKGKPRYQIELS